MPLKIWSLYSGGYQFWNFTVVETALHTECIHVCDKENDFLQENSVNNTQHESFHYKRENLLKNHLALCLALARELQHWQQQRGRQKSNRFKLAKQQLCTVVHHAFFNICCRYTSMTWIFQISCFMEDGNTRQRFSSVLCLSGELKYCLSEFNFSKNRQPKTNQWSWNKSGKLFETARILFVGWSV